MMYKMSCFISTILLIAMHCIYSTFVAGAIVLVTVNITYARELSPSISIQPNNAVEVGEEVFFSAASTTYPDAKVLGKARYEWNFGDGYAFKFGSPYYYNSCSGIAVTHYYMKPGDYTVTLTVTIWAVFDGAGKPVGSPLATKTATSVVYVTGEAPMVGFEIQRAPFHNRLAQYLYVQIPEAYRGNQTALRVTLEGAKGSRSTLLSKNNLAAEERIFLDHKPLAQDNYVVIAELLDSANYRIVGGLWRDKFSKRYATIPKVGIDENNAFRVNGELFFSIGPFMTDKSRVQDFIDKASINILRTEGYYPKHSPATWNDYLSYAVSKGLLCSGPTAGDWHSTTENPDRFRFNINLARIAEYIQVNKDSPAMFAWTWQDEPNMGGRAEKVYTPSLAAWAYVSHREDPHHPVYNNFYGYDWSKYYGIKPNSYDYLASAPFFGGKKWVQDAIPLDSYPIYGRLHPALNFIDMGPYAAYLDALDRIQSSNKYLIPVLPAIHTCLSKSTNPNPGVTDDQVYMESWLNVIHGAKGITWFPYFDQANTGRWTAMKKFAIQMKVLAPVVLSPAPSRSVTDNANVALNRVDTLVREKDGSIYVFAARVTEPDPIAGAKYQGVEPIAIMVNFSISGLIGKTEAEVIDEGRTVTLTYGQLTDEFVKNAIHIYKIISPLNKP